MASVEVFPELRVAVASEDAQESLTLLHSNHVDDLAPHTTLHHLEVTSGTRFAILLTFNTYALRANPASCIEVSSHFRRILCDSLFRQYHRDRQKRRAGCFQDLRRWLHGHVQDRGVPYTHNWYDKLSDCYGEDDD
jgi:hypothetical protein